MKKSNGQRNEIKYCMLEEGKICDDCLECNVCDLNPKKLCDNCAKCIDPGIDYKVVEIDEIVIEKDLRKKLKIVDERKVDKKTTNNSV